MESRLNLLLLGLYLCPVWNVLSDCGLGYESDPKQNCHDTDECAIIPSLCNANATCFNTRGSYYCQCHPGFKLTSGKTNFTTTEGSCGDINECLEGNAVCGPNATCHNIIGSYHCTCDPGFLSSTGEKTFLNGSAVTCAEMHKCAKDQSLCGYNAACPNTPGDYHQLNCDQYRLDITPEQTPSAFKNMFLVLRNNCLALSKSEEGGGGRQLSGEELLKGLLSTLDELLSGGQLNDNRKVTTILKVVEKVMRLIGLLLTNPITRMSSVYTEVELLVKRGVASPQGPIHLSSQGASLHSHWETAAVQAAYPGFTVASLLEYKGLESSTNDYFYGIHTASDGVSFRVNSRVVTASVSKMDTKYLDKPVTFNFTHLQSTDRNHTCVYWNETLEGGAWSEEGCTNVESDNNHTVCSCTHLSSFAVLMALYEQKDMFQLQVITWVGLSLSLICLSVCIATFACCHSIQGTRNTIHLHLCISLFIADLVFLVGISRTENKYGCAFVAGLLHFFFLAAFCWMCLEGVQLYRMVVLVFNTTLRPLHMMLAGYGVPAIIVAVSAITNSKGYGTKKYCWLSLEKGFIWSFFGPICVIIVVNGSFFLITVWKLAEKFSSLNPNLSVLQKIRTFTVTAVAQLCVLGSMWIFGCFQFEEKTWVMSYLFTTLNSLQGALVFIMHCLLSKQVREEYSNFLSSICTRQKYTEFSSNQSSNSQAPKSSLYTKSSKI